MAPFSPTLLIAKSVSAVVVLRKGVGTVQVVQAGCHAVRCAVAVVGGIQIDDIGSGVAHKGTGLLGHGDQVGRGHHMVGVIQIDLAYSGELGCMKATLEESFRAR